MSRSVSAPSSVTNTSPCWNGLIVPGSTLMYGSNFWSATERPRARRRWPIEAEAMPLPSAETTPPVTKMKRVWGRVWGIEGSGSERTNLRGGSQELLGMPPGSLVGRLGTEHPAELLDHAFAGEGLDRGEGELVVGRFLDPEVPRGDRSDLRQMRDAEELMLVAECAQALADRPGGLPPDARVDLVEHERRRAARA